jgi:hypothetical protein
MAYPDRTIEATFRLLSAWTIAGMICLSLGACGESIATETAPPSGMDGPHVAYYGVVYPYPEDAWSESDRPAIRERLAYLQNLGINTVVQVFPSEMITLGTRQNWLIFLDEAQRVGIQVVARLYPSNEGSGKEFNYQDIDEFLSVVQGHPALLAYLGLHEPLEEFDSEQLRKFYRHIRAVAPGLRVAHYMDDMAWFDASPGFPGRHFTAEICDICMIWYYPSMYENDAPIFDVEHLQQRVRANRALVDERSPGSELWFLGQAHSNLPGRFRMPTAEEMEIMFEVASRAGVDGFIWYAWLHDQYDVVLSDPQVAPQREIIRKIYETYLDDAQVK